MARTARPRLLRSAAAAVLVTAASLTKIAWGSDVVDDGAGQEVEEGVDEAEREVEENTDGEDG